MTRTSILLALVALSGAATGALAGGELVAVNSSTFGGSFGAYSVDQTFGTASLITTIAPGVSSLTGAAFLGGRLYASDIFGTTNELGEIDLGTGAYTPLVSWGGANIHGLAANEGAGILYGLDNGVLYSIDPIAKTATPGPSAPGMEGLGYDDANGILYGTDGGSLWTIDTTFGTATFVGSMGILSGTALGMDYDEVDKTLWVTAGSYGGGAFDLYKVNPATGAGTFVGSTGVDNLDGLAWRIPAPGSLALLGLGGLAAARRRRA